MEEYIVPFTTSIEWNGNMFVSVQMRKEESNIYEAQNISVVKVVRASIFRQYPVLFFSVGYTAQSMMQMQTCDEEVKKMLGSIQLLKQSLLVDQSHVCKVIEIYVGFCSLNVLFKLQGVLIFWQQKLLNLFSLKVQLQFSPRSTHCSGVQGVILVLSICTPSLQQLKQKSKLKSMKNAGMQSKDTPNILICPCASLPEIIQIISNLTVSCIDTSTELQFTTSNMLVTKTQKKAPITPKEINPIRQLFISASSWIRRVAGAENKSYSLKKFYIKSENLNSIKEQGILEYLRNTRLTLQKMKTISKFFKQFDFFSAPVTLRVHNDPQMKSLPIGVSSFVILLLFVFIFISTFISTVKYESIDSQLRETVIPESRTQGYVEAVAIAIDQLSYQEITSMFILYYNTKNNGVFSQKYIKMYPCQPNQWSALGDGYVDKFYEYKLDKMVCVNSSLPFKIQKLRQSSNSSNIEIQLVFCTFSQFTPIETCNLTKASQYILQNTPKISIFILDTALSPDQKNFTKPFVNMDAKFYISDQLSSKIDIEFSSYRIQTDTSLMPYQQIELIEGIKIGNIRNSIKQYHLNSTTDNVGIITISMNQNQQIYKRQVGKLKKLLSYVGGLLGTLSTVIAFFLTSFNQYRYELRVAERILSPFEGYKVKEEDFNLLTYVKYSLFDWIKILFCIELDWDQCKKIDEVRDVINSQMEVNRFYKRIQNAETALIYINGQDKIDLIKIQKPALFKKVQQRKLKLDYYSKVIREQQKTKKVADFITAEQALHEFFKKLLKDQAQKRSQIQYHENIGNITRIIQENSQQQISEPTKLKYSQQLKHRSNSIKLPNQYAQIEQNLSHSVYKLNHQRPHLLKDIPILIAYRLIAIKTQQILNFQSK